MNASPCMLWICTLPRIHTHAHARTHAHTHTYTHTHTHTLHMHHTHTYTHIHSQTYIDTFTITNTHQCETTFARTFSLPSSKSKHWTAQRLERSRQHSTSTSLPILTVKTRWRSCMHYYACMCVCSPCTSLPIVNSEDKVMIMCYNISYQVTITCHDTLYKVMITCHNYCRI